MQKFNFFILKYILGIDPYVLKQEKENNWAIFFSIFTITYLGIFFFTLMKSIEAILYELQYIFIFLISIIAFLPFYNVFSFALISWRSHNSFLSNGKNNRFSYYFSKTLTLFIRCIFLFLTLGLFIGLSYTLLNQKIVSQDIELFKKTLILDYKENLKEQVEIDKKIESREYFYISKEINKLQEKIKNSNSKLDSLSYLSLKKPLVEKKELLKKEIEVLELQFLENSNKKLKKYEQDIHKNPFFLKSLIYLSNKDSFLKYAVLILLIFGTFMFLFWKRFVSSKSTYHKIDNHLHKNAIILTSTPIIKSTIEIVKSKFNYDYKIQFPIDENSTENKIKPEVVLGKDDFITKLRKNEL
ncbi:hypothetical protein [Polaribacter sp.]|uniref:hypothetical protein n=1 Tax=Polaribacter sp. TaxID=1920175 RepID=UPI0025D338DC|nr:hypothetical protein [Polaribacter sp.]